MKHDETKIEEILQNYQPLGHDDDVEFVLKQYAEHYLSEYIKNYEKEKAEQQILGFYNCYKGAMLKDLCSSMGLTGKEFKSIKDELEYLPDELYNEIVDYLNRPNK